MDAPPTGRIGRFLNVTSEVSGLARVGPIRGHADTVQRVIRSPDTAVHFVTVLEEMPVQETLDGIAELAGLPGGGIQIGGIMINMTRPLPLPADQIRAAAEGRLDTGELALGLKAAGLDDSRRLAAALADELAADARTALGQELQRARLDRGRAAVLRAALDQRRDGPGRAVPAGRRAAGPGGRLMAGPPPLDMDRLIDDRRTRIIVCCGSGGVGKTTTAAAVGRARGRARAARRGADRRPGPPPGPVHGPDLAGQHPPAGARASVTETARAACTP